MKDKKLQDTGNPRLGTVGGQAVLEGVMMKAGNKIAVSVRRPDKSVATRVKTMAPMREKYKLFGIPLIRGFINFIEMMSLSISTLNDSAEMLEEEQGDTQPSAPEKKGGVSWTAAATAAGAVLGLGLSILLFFYLPSFIGRIVIDAIEVDILRSLVEGIIRIAIFVGYILLVSLMKDIRRTFEYHGAEHMAVFCHEACDPMTVENVRKYSRFHPRCGTSFMIVMMVIGIIIGMCIPVAEPLLRTLIKLAVFPFVIGLGYEFIRYAGKHDNALIRALSAPGMWVQRLTTRTPDELQIEVAIASLKSALPAVYPPEQESSDGSLESINDGQR